MKRWLGLLLALVFVAGCGVATQSNTQPNNRSVKPLQEVVKKDFDDYKVEINKADFGAYTKAVSQIIKHSVDIDLPMSDKNKTIVDEYVNKYHGSDYYSNAFTKRYSEKDRMVMEDVWFASVSLNNYFDTKVKLANEKDQQKILEYQKTIENDKKTVISEVSRNI